MSIENDLRVLSKLGDPTLLNLDKKKEVSFTGMPEMYARRLEIAGIPPTNENTTLLALAAGSGSAERSFADKMNISPQNCTYTDIEPTVTPEISEGGRVEAWDLVTALTYAIDDATRYNYITAMGVDYIFENEEQVLALFKVIAYVLEDNGVLIFPSPKYMPALEKIEALGYEEIARYVGLYIYKKTTDVKSK